MPAVYCWDAQTNEYDNDDDDEEGGDKLYNHTKLKFKNTIINHSHSHSYSYSSRDMVVCIQASGNETKTSNTTLH